MKTLTILCLLVAGCVCLLVAGCGNESERKSSLWMFGDDDALGVRVGTEIAENIEIGASTNYWLEDDGDSQLYGAYALYYLPSADDAIVCTYVGAQTPLNNTYYDRVAPVAGIIYDKIFFTEYQYKNWESKESQEEDKIVFGVRIKF